MEGKACGCTGRETLNPSVEPKSISGTPGTGALLAFSSFPDFLHPHDKTPLLHQPTNPLEICILGSERIICAVKSLPSAGPSNAPIR